MTPATFRKLLSTIGQWPAPLPVHPHMLRHACGYKLAHDGHDTRALQEWLGHSNIQNTTRYTELTSRRFKEFLAARRLPAARPRPLHRCIHGWRAGAAHPGQPEGRRRSDRVGHWLAVPGPPPLPSSTPASRLLDRWPEAVPAAGSARGRVRGSNPLAARRAPPARRTGRGTARGGDAPRAAAMALSTSSALLTRSGSTSCGGCERMESEIPANQWSDPGLQVGRVGQVVPLGQNVGQRRVPEVEDARCQRWRYVPGRVLGAVDQAKARADLARHGAGLALGAPVQSAGMNRRKVRLPSASSTSAQKRTPGIVPLQRPLPACPGSS